MPTLIRDLSDSSGYWAAVWTMCAMPDVHVICDAPVGCFNLVATAVPDYTDSIPHIENITPSTITEREVGGHGTAGKVKLTYEGLRDTGVLAGKHLILVSTAESEMIGSDLTNLISQLQPGTTFYYSNSLAEDEWAGRDRVLRWLWEQYGKPHAADVQIEPGTVNIIGPTYGCFNAPSDLSELKRLIAGAGGRINMVYPFESNLSDTPRLAAAQINIVLFKEFGQGLAAELGQPTLLSPFGMRDTITFVRALGELLGTSEQAEAFIAHEKKTTLSAVWDLWRGPQGDWFGTTDIGIVAGRAHAEGIARFLGEELGMPIAFVTSRPLRPGDLDNEGVRQLLHKRAPAFVFGSVNERIYLAEAGAKFTTFLPSAFPGAVVRRSVGTPFVGFRGAVYLIQEIMNGLYNVLFNFLPVDAAYAGGAKAVAGPGSSNGSGGPQTEAPGNLQWDADAKQVLDDALEKLPFIPRISASRQLQMQVETLARQRGLKVVGLDLVEEALASSAVR
ncbi:MAG: chlorophyllide a reductase subunit Z [Roseiflexaceae bacterium]|nr:chlorophyllide a reductase subunit Z [Roseiflexaceae bacterium]